MPYTNIMQNSTFAEEVKWDGKHTKSSRIVGLAARKREVASGQSFAIWCSCAWCLKHTLTFIYEILSSNSCHKKLSCNATGGNTHTHTRTATWDIHRRVLDSFSAPVLWIEVLYHRYAASHKDKSRASPSISPFFSFSLSLPVSQFLSSQCVLDLRGCRWTRGNCNAVRKRVHCVAWKEGRKGEESDEVEGVGWATALIIYSLCAYYVCGIHVLYIHRTYVYYILKHLNAPQFFYCFNYTCTHNPKHTHTHTPLHDRRTDLFL